MRPTFFCCCCLCAAFETAVPAGGGCRPLSRRGLLPQRVAFPVPPPRPMERKAREATKDEPWGPHGQGECLRWPFWPIRHNSDWRASLPAVASLSPPSTYLPSSAPPSQSCSSSPRARTITRSAMPCSRSSSRGSRRPLAPLGGTSTRPAQHPLGFRFESAPCALCPDPTLTSTAAFALPPFFSSPPPPPPPRGPGLGCRRVPDAEGHRGLLPPSPAPAGRDPPPPLRLRGHRPATRPRPSCWRWWRART